MSETGFKIHVPRPSGLVDARGRPLFEVAPPKRKKEPITRQALEKVRIRVTWACLLTAVEQNKRNQPVRHLWFPENDINKRQLRIGNPPADSDRPPHLRGLQLVIDIRGIPDDVWEEMRRNRRAAKRASAEPTSMVRIVEDRDIIAATMRSLNKGTLLPRG